MKKEYNKRSFLARVSSDNVLFIEFKKVNELFVEDMKEVNTFFKEEKGSGTTYVVVSFKGFLPMKDDVMEEVKNQRKDLKDVVTICVVKNVGIRLAVKFFMSFYKTSHPIFIVSNQNEATSLISVHRSEKK